MKQPEPKSKPITGKRITYSSTINERSPKAARQANEFELVYKVKNRENEDHEHSYESMLVLKSKNKIKRYRGAHEKGKEKERVQSPATNIKDVFERISSKIQEHSKKTSPRLINLLSMSSGSPRSHIIVDDKVHSKRTKGNTKSKVDVTASKSDKIARQVRKPLESHIYVKEPSSREQAAEYIMIDDGFHPIAQDTHKNLASLMKSTYDKSKLTLNNLESDGEEIDNEEEDQEECQQILEQSALQIQRVWRGHRVRKNMQAKKQSLQQQKVNEIRMETSVNGMFIQLFQQIVDLDQQQTKVELLRAFREVLNKNKEGSNPSISKVHMDIAQKREQAIQSQFEAQTNILKCLLATKTITKENYLEKIQDLTKWGSLKRQQITKLHKTVDETNIKTREIIAQTDQLNLMLQSVHALNSSPQILLKCFEQIEKEILSYSFYEAEPVRQQSVAHHLPTEQNQTAEVKNTVAQQFETRQKIKAQIEKRMLQQLGYFNAEVVPVNTSNIGIHIFLSEILNYIEEYYRDDFLRWINMPYGYSSESRLKMLQGYDVKLGKENQGLIEGVQNVLSMEILMEYHRQTYSQTQIYNVYHQRAIFDAFNECLNVYRPYYSINGPPYLWNNSEKALTFYFIAEQNIEEVFEKTKQQILKHASSLCGILSDAPPSSLSLSDMLQLKHGCHQMIAQCRDEKLTKMEHQLVLTNEGDWSSTEEEKTQTMLNLSEFVLSEIMKQMVQDLKILIH